MFYLKLLAALFLTVVLIGMGSFWFDIFFIGRYYQSASFILTAIVGLFLPIAAIAGYVFALRTIFKKEA